MTDLTILSFLDATASDAPVPGGGSVSALCGALGASLGTMVCRLTLGRKKYAEHEPEIQELIGRITPKIDILNRAIALDSQAYNGVMTAFKLPKDTDEQKAARRAAISDASIEAARVPMNVAEVALQLMPELEKLVQIGNQNAITDVGVASMCVRTAVLGACLNVRINLGSISDAQVVADFKSRCDVAESEVMAAADRIYPIVHKATL